MSIDRETFIAYMERMMDRFDMLDKKIERRQNCLDGEKLLDNQDMMFLLKVSSRTLQRYRTKGILPFIKLNDGRCYYKESDVHKLIREKL